MKKVYLACPYSHPDYEVRQERLDAANMMAGQLMEGGYNVFSPLSHSGSIVEWGYGHSQEFWMRQDLPFVKWCDALFVMCLDGWDRSKGVAMEIIEAERLGKEVAYLLL